MDKRSSTQHSQKDLHHIDCNRDIAFSGSFDPITYGHISLIQRVLSRFENIHIIIANGGKKTLFSLDERSLLIQKSLEDTGLLSSRIKIEKWEGLLVDYCRSHGVSSILRGLRNMDDLKFERTMATINRQLDNRIETFFLLAEPSYREVSSTAIKELARVCTKPEQLKKFLTKSVIAAFQKRS